MQYIARTKLVQAVMDVTMKYPNQMSEEQVHEWYNELTITYMRMVELGMVDQDTVDQMLAGIKADLAL